MTMTSVSDPLVGHVLDDRYRITDRLARGGMATIYRATDTRLTRTVAVKVMHAGLGDDAEFSRRFDREARAAARLSHPNVVSVFDQGRGDLGHGEIRPYIVMEYVEGQTLRNVISRRAPLSPLRALDLIEPVLSALAAAHDAGLVHRDVKPENVLISDRGQIKVADFGLARAISAQTSTATQGLLIGTVSYLPPELVVSGRADARSDVYSTGVVLFELLTGRKPHTGETPIQVAYAHVHADVPPPSSLRTAGPIPPYLDALVARVTARNADARPPDARVMLTQVRRVRTALREGMSDDPELTQDLTVPLQQVSQDGSMSDRIDLGQSASDNRFDGDQERTDLVAGGFAAPDQTERTDPERRWAEQSWPDEVEFSGGQLHAGFPAERPNDQPESTDWRADRDFERDRRRRRRRLRGWLILLLVMLLTVLAGYTGWYLTKGRFTSAPSLTSLTQPDAQAAAQQAGLGVHFSQVYSEQVPIGSVISTDPTAGTKIRQGTDVEALVSRGPERHAVPTLVGLTQSKAEQAITGAQLVVGKITERFHDSIAKGTVLASSEKVGAQLRRSTAVDLTVSAGPKPIKITDYTGKSADDAVKALKKAGFAVTVTTQNSDEVAKGDVIKQTPDDGTGVKGDRITLVKSLGPVLIEVPNVRAMGVRAATEVMKKAGFAVSRRKASANYLGLGYVAYTSPGSGSKAPKGSTIKLFLI